MTHPTKPARSRSTTPATTPALTAAWDGPVGEHWAAHQDRYDTMLSGFNDALFAAAALGDRDRILDIGCGSGGTTRSAAGIATHGSVTGIDISRALIARARASTDDPRIVFLRSDAQKHPFLPGQFDVAISRGGVMFFADPRAAFARLGRALRPAGRLVFVCPPDRPDGEEAKTLGLLASMLDSGGQKASFHSELGAAMKSLSDPVLIREILTEAGFERITVTPVAGTTVWGRDPADAADFLLSRPGGGQARPSARAALTEALRPYAQEHGVALPASVWVVSAVRPG